MNSNKLPGSFQEAFSKPKSSSIELMMNSQKHGWPKIQPGKFFRGRENVQSFWTRGWDETPSYPSIAGTGLHLWMVGDAIHSVSSYIHHRLGFKQQPSCWKCLCYASFTRQNTMSAGHFALEIWEVSSVAWLPKSIWLKLTKADCKPCSSMDFWFRDYSFLRDPYIHPKNPEIPKTEWILELFWGDTPL